MSRGSDSLEMPARTVWRRSLDEVRAAMSTSGNVREPGMTMASGLQVLLYAPRESDPQSVHADDELYVIARGVACLVRPDGSTTLRAGDLATVPANMPHHFADMSSDFEAWTILCASPAGNRDDAGSTA